jgi:site-specific recombinase XerD
MQSAAWSPGLKPATRAQRSRFLAALVDAVGDIAAEDITSDDISAGMDRRKDRPHAANNWLKAMSGLFGWSASRKLLQSNPTLGVKHLAGPNDQIGFHTWTDDEITLFEERWPIGTRERVAFDLLFYTGLRRGDAVLSAAPTSETACSDCVLKRRDSRLLFGSSRSFNAHWQLDQ